MPDPIPAKIVQNIFNWKLEGLNLTAIAERLDKQGVLTPAEYRKSHLRNNPDNSAEWTPVAINRILSNKMYTGCLVQGKSEKPNFKVHTRKRKPTSDWICVDNTHDVIIPTELYEAVARLCLMDTRCVPGEKTVSTLAGFIRCKSCGENLIQRRVSSNNKVYVYYVCRTRTCSSHSIPKDTIEKEILFQVHLRTNEVKKLYKKMHSIDILRLNAFRKQEIISELSKINERFDKTQTCLDHLDNEATIRILKQSEIASLRLHYEKEQESLKNKKIRISAQLNDNVDPVEFFGWIKLYKPYFSSKAVTRPMLAYLVRRVTVDQDKKVKVEFLHEDECQFLCRYCDFLK